MEKFIAGWTLSNHGGVGVIEMESDFMKVQYYDDEPEIVEIQFEDADEAEDVEEWAEYPRAFVQLGSYTLYLDECMRY